MSATQPFWLLPSAPQQLTNKRGSNTNLLTANQSSFESGTTGWAAGANTTIAQSAAQFLDGTKSLSLTAVGAGAISAATQTGVAGVPVTAGVLYTYLLYIKAGTVLRSVTPTIFWWQAGGAASAVRASDVGGAFNDATANFVFGFMNAVAPSDAAFASISISVAAAGVGEAHFIDEVAFFVGSTTGWSIGTGGATDTIGLAARTLAFQASSMRFIATRTRISGSASTPQVFHDTGQVGIPHLPPIPALPESAAVAGAFSAPVYYPNSCATWNGRIYLVEGLGGMNAGLAQTSIVSALIAGVNHCGWRFEGTFAPIMTAADQGVACRTSMCIVAGYIYVLVSGSGSAANVYYAPINADGTLGTWAMSTLPNTVGAGAGVILGYAGPATTTPWLTVIQAAAGNSWISPIDATTAATGKPTGWTATGAGPVTGSAQSGYLIDILHAKVWCFGSGAAPTAVVAGTTLNVATGATASGVWTANATGLPAARCMFGMATLGDFETDPTAQVIIVGGGSAAGGATPQTTWWFIASSDLQLGSVAWTATGAALPTALSKNAAWTTQWGHSTVALNPSNPFHSELQSPNLTFAALGAGLVTTAAPATLTGAPIPLQAIIATPPLSPWYTGAAPVLATGGGLTVTPNALAGNDYAWNYGGFGTPALSGGFLDGDTVQVSVQFVDPVTSTLSPIAITSFRVGQPPSLASLLPGASIATGRPTASLAFVQGAGGGLEAAWQITFKIGATVYFDSGVRRDTINSVLVNLFPLLLTAAGYTATWTVWSTDDIFNGATNMATSTLVVTPTLAAVTAPSSLTATPDNVNGIINLAWTNNSAPATPGSRIGYRRTGSGLPFRLLAELPGLVTSYAAMDEIAGGVSYDFVVSQLNLAAPNAIESVVSNTAVAQLAFTGCSLHVAGQGATLRAMLGMREPAFVTEIAATVVQTMAASSPAIRYGLKRTSTVDLEALGVPLAIRQAASALLAQAQAGSVLYYRDGLGFIFTCGLDAARNWPGMAPRYVGFKAKLIQVANPFPVVLTQGSALGIPTLVNGDMPPLDSSERAA